MSDIPDGNKGHRVETNGNESLKKAIDRRHDHRRKNREENPWEPKQTNPVKGSWQENNR